jgi:hypothetical protein
LLAFSIILSFVLISCGNGSTGGGGNNGGGAITDGVIAQGLQVKDATNVNLGYFTGSLADLPNYTGTLDFSNQITTGIPGSSVKVTNGKLNMTLGTPTDAAFSYTQSYLSANDITLSPSDAKVFYKEEGDGILFLTSDLKYTLYCFQSIKPIVAGILAYADKDVTGTRTVNGIAYNVVLKKGWNYLMINNSSAPTASQQLPDGCYWVVMNPRACSH